MPINRSLGRNVRFYNALKPSVALGGLIQNGSVTEAYDWDRIHHGGSFTRSRKNFRPCRSDNEQPKETLMFIAIVGARRVGISITNHGCIESSRTASLGVTWLFVMESMLEVEDVSYRAL